MPDAPNVLFLMDDEHRPDVLGHAGDDVVRTPNLDRLAEDACVFENAYTPSPKCVPARQCMMAGQLPRTCGVEAYAEDLPSGSLTFARQFARHGYMTTCGGKLHHADWDQMQGWRKRIGENIPVYDRYVEQADDTHFPRYNSAGTWSTAKHVRRAGVGRGPWADCDEHTIDGIERYVDRYFTDPYYFKHEEDKPLFLKMSLHQPHFPFLSSEERVSYYMNRVDPFFGDNEVSENEALRRNRVVPGEDVEERDIRLATAAYYGMVEAVDERFGRVLDALEAAGEDLDEWIIVFTSDHGEMLGEHGVWMKSMFYEGSARVPLFIRWPAQFEGRQIEQNVTLCDLYATLCDLTDIPTPMGLDSRSLVPLLEGRAGEWRDEAVSAVNDRVMIKQKDLKYQHYPDHGEVLFDLSEDPKETTNVVEDPTYAEAVEQFRERRRSLGYGPNPDEYENAGYNTAQ